MPCRRARTSSATTAMLNSTCAAITAQVPICSLMPRPASEGLTRSKNDTKAISVEMPMTMPGTMMAM